MLRLFTMLGIVATLFALCCTLLCCSKAPKELSYEELRLRYRESLVGRSSLPLDDSMVVARLAAVDQHAQQWWSTLNTAPERPWLWEDCNTQGVSTITLMPYVRLGAMTLAYAMEGSKYYGNDSLKHDIIGGLEWMYAHRYNPTIAPYDNWWMWVIGTPLSLNRMMVLLYDDLTPQQIEKYAAAMNHYAPTVEHPGASTGANKIWQCSCVALRGIITQNRELIEMAVQGLDTEFKTVTAHDGFYEDGSFVQHQWHPYTGGYGRSLLDHMTEMINLVEGSSWPVPQRHIDMLFGWIQHSYEPLLYKGTMMEMVRGRESARPGAAGRGTGHSILLSIFKLSLNVSGPMKDHLQSVVKAHALKDTDRNLQQVIPLCLLGAYRQMMAATEVVPLSAKNFHKQFSMMDRVVHQMGDRFSIGLAMSSARIENYETINEENLKGWYSADGMVYLYDNDLKQFTDDFWPTINPYRMPGTTVDTRQREAKTLPLAPGLLYADGYKSPQHWVGGSSVGGSYGSVGMWLDAQGSTLEAKKSWFMAADEIVCLGAGINSTDNRPIETIIDNRKLNAGKTYRVLTDTQQALPGNGVQQGAMQWVHLEGVEEQTAIGYYFPQKSEVNLLRETREGSWSQINGIVKVPQMITASYFTLWTPHGNNPTDATYAYVLLPGRSAEQTAAYAAAPTTQVLANSAAVQAVRFAEHGVTGANFWIAAAAPQAGIRVNAPASVTLWEQNGQLVVGVSDPTQLNKEGITVEIARAATQTLKNHPQVEVLSTSPTIRLHINSDAALGATREVTFQL